MSDDNLPAAHIKRLAKHKLNELMAELGPDAKGNKQEGNLQKEALAAFNESAKIFIHYLTATANDLCRDGKRQTISVDDVFRAIEELEFGEFTEPLKQSLEGTSHKHKSGVPTKLFQTFHFTQLSDVSPIRLAGFKKSAAAKTAQRTEREDKKRKAAAATAGDDEEGEGEGDEEAA